MFGCSWYKVKSIAFQVSAPDLEVSIGFGIRAWFISSSLASVLIWLGDLPLVTVNLYIQLITLRWEGWLRFDQSLTFPQYFRVLMLNSLFVFAVTHTG